MSSRRFPLWGIGSTFLALLVLASCLLDPALKGKAGPNFKRVLIVIFENVDYDKVMAQGFFKAFAAQGATLTHFNGETHPSQPNYFALTSGQMPYRDNLEHQVDTTNVVDLLEAKGKTWKAYAEGYPGNCDRSMVVGKYVRRHNPFISYVNIQNQPARCAKIVNENDFAQDLQNSALPDYSFYVPDLNNDGHDTGIAFANSWFEKSFARWQQSPQIQDGTLVVATFDESASTNPDLHSYTAFWGSMVIPGSVWTPPSDHYTILRTIEEGMGLGTLQRFDENSVPVMGVWR